MADVGPYVNPLTKRFTSGLRIEIAIFCVQNNWDKISLQQHLKEYYGVQYSSPDLCVISVQGNVSPWADTLVHIVTKKDK